MKKKRRSKDQPWTAGDLFVTKHSTESFALARGAWLHPVTTADGWRSPDWSV